MNFKIKFETWFHIYLILDAEFINFMIECIAMNFKIKSVLTNLMLLERPVKCSSKGYSAWCNKLRLDTKKMYNFHI